MQHTRLRSLLVVALGASVLAIAPAAIPVARAADNPTFHGLPPARLMDTRPGQPTVDGAFAGGGPITTDGTRSVTVVGRGGVPATGAGSVALNVTATNTTSSGYLTVYPAGAARPTASNLNVTPGITIPNMVITPIGTGGQITVYNSSGNTDVIVDVLGWFPATGGFTPLTPARLVDTRLGHPTIDGASAGFGAIPGTATYTVFAGGRGGVAPAGTVKAVALNVTVTNPSIAGYLTVFPAYATRPTASNLNYVTGQTIPNMVIVPVSESGQVSFYNGSAGNVDIVVDVLGYFTGTTDFTGLTPARVFETRIGQPTADGKFAGYGSLFENSAYAVKVTGRGGVPETGVGAVALNVTVTNPTAAGYLTVYPAGLRHPTASNLNFVPGQTIPNMVIVPVGTAGQVAIFNSAGQSDIIVDVLGWFPNATTPPTPVGNSITMRATGLGTHEFGAATPADTLPDLAAVLGPPTTDETIAFTFDPVTGYTADDGLLSYSHPFGREVCWINSLCIDFGGASPGAVVLTSYAYYSNEALLFDANGLGNFSRLAEYPTAFSATPQGCYSYGSGQTTAGIALSLSSRGAFFNGTLPAASDIYVTGFFSGDSITFAEEGDC